MKKRFQFASIQMRIAVTFSLVILATMVSSIVLSYRFSFNAVRNNSLQYTYQLVQQVSTDVDSYIKYMQDISLIMAYNNDVKAFLNDINPTSPEQMDRKIEITEQLNSISLARNDVADFAVLGSDGRHALSKENLRLNEYVKPESENWYIEAVKADGEPVISSSHVQNIFKDNYTYVVSLSRALKNEKTKKVTGVILVDLNYNRIRDLCSNISLGKRGYIFIVDNHGDIVYHPQQQLIYSNLKYEFIDEVIESKEDSFTVNDGKDSRVYTIKESKYGNWKIVGVTYLNELVVNNETIRTYYLLAGILFLSTSLVLSYNLAQRISRPIKRLETSMKEIEKGNFDTKVQLVTKDEIGQLSKNFNIMTAEIKKLIAENQREYERKRRYELKALQNQINPHFLYNTLDSIVWMAETDNNEEVVLMTSSLARLFRISLSKGTEFITIRDEIDHIESYLIIQGMRYKNKISFELDIDDDVLKKYTPKIILQPLVENAIYHGIKNKEGIGTITIEGKIDRANDKVILKVMDTGMGMSEEEKSSIFDKKKGKDSGVGVRVTNERIKLHFGSEYGICFESILGEGTTAIISLPIIEEEWGNDNQ